MTTADEIRKIQGKVLDKLPPQKKYIPPLIPSVEPPIDPLLEYETDGVFDAAKYLAHEGERSAAIGMVKALERGDASALRLQAQLTGKLDAPQEVRIELDADVIARISFNADRKLGDSPYGVESLFKER